MFNDTIANIVMAAMVISCFGALLCWQFTLSRVFKSAAEHGYFPKVFARVNSKDAPVRGVFILLAVETLLTLFTASDSLREQFEVLVNLAVVTNVVPYVLCILAVPTMMRMAGVAESRIKRSNYVFGVGVIYCLYAIYACGVDAMLGSAVVNNFLFCLIDRLVIHHDRIHVDHGLTAKFFLQFLLDPIDHVVDLKDIAIP